jgi:hypothetical protein
MFGEQPVVRLWEAPDIRSKTTQYPLATPEEAVTMHRQSGIFYCIFYLPLEENFDLKLRAYVVCI